MMRFVIIEDNPADVLLMKEALEHEGIKAEISHFSDGADAVQAMRSNHATWADTPPSLVLLDLNMPRVSGFDVLREIRGTPRLQHVPVAVVTSSHSPTDMAEATRLGASRYIRKPVDLHEFFAMVGNTVRGILAEAA
jgi:CheY-like chemotaxis protein